MQEALEQLALIDTLLANWDLIRARMGIISPALAAEFNALGQKLRNAASINDVAPLIAKLLALTRQTAAASYARELVGRASLDDGSSERSGAASLAVTPDPEVSLAAPVDARETSGSGGGVLAQTSALPPGVERAPVFFATNRKPGDASATSFSGEIGEVTSVGLASVTIPVGIHQTGKLERPGWWDRFANCEDPQQHFTLSGVQTLKQAEFASKLDEAAGSAGTKDLLIFLHGFRVTFEEAAMRAAQFARDSRFPGLVVLFSWPSEGSVLHYAADEERALASSDRLAAFLGGLENGPWQRVHLLAHSMGNRVMLAGLADNPRPKLPFGQLVFAAADVYTAVFEQKFAKLQDAGRIPSTSYASKKDRALRLSSFLHRGTRVGMVEDIPYVTAHLESIDATAVDKGFLGHGYWSDERTLITDLQRLLQDGLSAKQRQLDQIGNYWAFPK